jgi:hypothetical protein
MNGANERMNEKEDVPRFALSLCHCNAHVNIRMHEVTRNYMQSVQRDVWVAYTLRRSMHGILPFFYIF